MSEFRVGMTVPDSAPNGSGLAARLDAMEGLGLDCVELPLYSLDLLIGGRVNGSVVARARRACAGRPFGYSAHLPLSINFWDEPGRLARHFEILLASMDLAAEFGAVNGVMHTGIFRAGMAGTIADATARQRHWLARAGEEARTRGITLCVENLFRWGDVAHSLTPSGLAADLAAIDHPNVRATLDFSHAYIQAAQNDCDFVGEVAALAPFAAHAHAHDSFGRPEGGQYFYSGSEAIAFGSGDLHLCVGRGSLPWAEVAERATFPRGALFNIELNDRYFDDQAAECVAATRAFAGAARFV